MGNDVSFKMNVQIGKPWVIITFNNTITVSLVYILLALFLHIRLTAY